MSKIGISRNTFRRFIKKAKIHIGSKNYISEKEVNEIQDKLELYD